MGSLSRPTDHAPHGARRCPERARVRVRRKEIPPILIFSQRASEDNRLSPRVALLCNAIAYPPYAPIGVAPNDLLHLV